MFSQGSKYPLSVYSIHIDGLVKDCSNSSALAMELLQSCAKPSIRYSSYQVGKDYSYYLFLLKSYIFVSNNSIALAGSVVGSPTISTVYGSLDAF